MFQSIPLAHAWDMGQTEEPMEARFPWVRAGALQVAGDGSSQYAGEHVWMCFRGLQVPAGATIISATVGNLAMPGAGRLRCHAVADADPPGGLDALHAALAALGTAVATVGGTSEQQAAAAAFWLAATDNGNSDYSTPEGRAEIRLVLTQYHADYINYVNSGYTTYPYQWIIDMVDAYGAWETSWPYNWAGWTPDAEWDMEPPASGEMFPDLAVLIQERVDATGWMPGNAVLLLVSPPEGAVEGATVALTRNGTPALAVTWEVA